MYEIGLYGFDPGTFCKSAPTLFWYALPSFFTCFLSSLYFPPFSPICFSSSLFSMHCFPGFYPEIFPRFSPMFFPIFFPISSFMFSPMLFHAIYVSSIFCPFSSLFSSLFFSLCVPLFSFQVPQKNGKEMVLCQFMLYVALFVFMLGFNISS